MTKEKNSHVRKFVLFAWDRSEIARMKKEGWGGSQFSVRVLVHVLCCRLPLDEESPFPSVLKCSKSSSALHANAIRHYRNLYGPRHFP